MIGKRLKELREEKELNQEEFAKVLNISRSSIGMYESGKREPSDELKKQMADFFNCSVDYLIGNSDIKREPSQILGFDKAKIIEALEIVRKGKTNTIEIETDDLTDEDIEEIKEFVRFRKERRKKN